MKMLQFGAVCAYNVMHGMVSTHVAARSVLHVGEAAEGGCHRQHADVDIIRGILIELLL